MRIRLIVGHTGANNRYAASTTHVPKTSYPNTRNAFPTPTMLQRFDYDLFSMEFNSDDIVYETWRTRTRAAVPINNKRSAVCVSVRVWLERTSYWDERKGTLPHVARHYTGRACKKHNLSLSQRPYSTVLTGNAKRSGAVFSATATRIPMKSRAWAETVAILIVTKPGCQRFIQNSRYDEWWKFASHNLLLTTRKSETSFLFNDDRLLTRELAVPITRFRSILINHTRKRFSLAHAISIHKFQELIPEKSVIGRLNSWQRFLRRYSLAGTWFSRLIIDPLKTLSRNRLPTDS